MKPFIKILFAVTFTSLLFAEDETSVLTSESMDNNIQQVTDNAKTKAPDRSSISLPDNTPATDVTTNDEEAEAASEEDLPIEDIRDIRPAVDLPIETWQIIAVSCVLLAFLIALIYILRKRHRQQSGISIIPPDPYHKALQELEAALRLIQHIDQRPFATGITDSVRGYLAAVFSLPAPECTTEEVLEQLPNVALLTEEMRQNITHLLQQCDLAKFTKLQFDQPDRLKLYNQAKEFIQSADKLIQLQNANTPEP